MPQVRLVIAAFFVLATTHTLALFAAETGAETAALPNIVFIMADDLLLS